MSQMKNMYRKFLRGNVWYSQNNKTEEQERLKTKDRTDASRLLDIKNNPFRIPAFHLQIARTHMQMGNPKMENRTWQQVMEALVQTKLKEQPKIKPLMQFETRWWLRQHQKPCLR